MDKVKPYWHKDADFSGYPFFIRRMNTCGYVKAAEVPRASLPLIGFIYLNAGEVLVEVEDKSYLCGPGHLLLIPEHKPFSILHYSDAVGFTGGFQPSLFASSQAMHFLEEPLQQAFWFDEAAFFGELFNMLMLSFEKKDMPFIEKGMDLLLSKVKTSIRPLLPEIAASFLDEIFSQENNFLPVREYARKRGVSLNYLNRVVRQSTRRSLSSWIDIARVNRAKKLLKESNSPIAEVAASTGIFDQAYFARFFKKHSGMTPSEFRNLMHV